MTHSISSHLIYDNEHISECLNFDLVLRTSCKQRKNVIAPQKCTAMVVMVIVAHTAEGCPVLPWLVLRQLGTSLDTWTPQYHTPGGPRLSP